MKPRTARVWKLVVVGVMLLCFAYVEFSSPGVTLDGPMGGAAGVLDEGVLFQPAKYPAGDWEPAGLDFEDVTFTAADGGTRLHGWFCRHEAAVAVVLYLHGNAGNVTQRAAVLRRLQSEHDAAVLIFDYRGYGRSEGEPTIAGVIDDAKGARAELARLAKIDASEIVLMGRSLGGAIAVQLAAEQRCRGLVLESTFSSLKGMARRYFPGRAALVPETTLNSAAAIQKYHGPLLQCHGEDDRVIPIAAGERLFAGANEPKEFVAMRGVGHNDVASEGYVIALDVFLRSLR